MNIQTLSKFILTPIALTIAVSFVLYSYKTNNDKPQVTNDQPKPSPIIANTAQAPEEAIVVDTDEVVEVSIESKIKPRPIPEPVPSALPDGFINARVGNTDYVFELRQTNEERRQGLSGRPGLPLNTGMLFIFDTPGKHSFWMKDMLFNIDIIWFDADKNVVHVESNVSPDTFPRSFGPSTDTLYVLELPAGTYTGQAIHFSI